MQQEEMLKELEAAAARLDVKVSYEALQSIMGAGGMCRVRGQVRIIIDKRAQLGERVATLAQALAQLDIADVSFSAPVADLIKHYALRRAS